MATLNTLRTKGGWIVTTVIFLALMAFLIGDLASGNSIFSSGGQQVGSVDGQKISYMEYAQKIDDLNEIQEVMNGGQAAPADMQAALRNYAWELLQSEIVLFPGLGKMGIDISEDEMFDRIQGNNISPVLINSGLFNNGDGVYDKALMQNFVSSYQMDPTGKTAKLWKHIQDQVRQSAMIEKYQALLAGMAYVTEPEAARGAKRSEASYNARYVSQGYETVPDSLIELSASEVRAYYNAHKEQYLRPAGREVEYVVFEVLPSAADYADARAQMDEMSAEFARNENMQQYVALNSQEPFDPVYYTREQLPADLAEYAFNPARTELYGPMLNGNVYTATRVADLRSFPDTVAFRQMQFMPGTEALADSIFTVLRRGGDFEALATEYSVIPAASIDAGRMPTQGIPIEIGEQIYNTNDRLVKITLPNGTILLDVYYRGPVSPKVQLANLVYYVEPSSVTQQAAYAKASAFYTATAGLPDQFDKIAADSSYAKQAVYIQAAQQQIAGLNEPREMIRWAFNAAKAGVISPIMEIDNNYVIAVLNSAHEHGYTPLEEVRPQIVAGLTQDKVYERIAAKMAGAASIDALAQSLSTTVGDMENVNYGTIFLPGLSVMDAPLVGAVAGGVPEGALSKPIKGASGVYVVEITSTSTADQATTPEMERARLEAEAEYNLGARIANAIVTKSKVVDERAKYY